MTGQSQSPRHSGANTDTDPFDGKTVTKKELVSRIADRTGQTKVVTKDIIQMFLDEIITVPVSQGLSRAVIPVLHVAHHTAKHPDVGPSYKPAVHILNLGESLNVQLELFFIINTFRHLLKHTVKRVYQQYVPDTKRQLL